METVRTNLRMALALRDRKAAHVSQEAGLSVNAVGQFLAGHTSISHANLLRICDVLAIPIGALHIPGAITPERLRLHALLSRLPDHAAHQVLEIVADLDRSTSDH